MSFMVGSNKQSPDICIKLSIWIDCGAVIIKNKVILRGNVSCEWIQNKMYVSRMYFTQTKIDSSMTFLFPLATNQQPTHLLTIQNIQTFTTTIKRNITLVNRFVWYSSWLVSPFIWMLFWTNRSGSTMKNVKSWLMITQCYVSFYCSSKSLDVLDC